MLKFDRQGLVPAVIQDDATGEVLMVAFMNQEAFQRTRETGYTHFFSRSRNTIWRKGEQSGNVQEVRNMFVNCEENSLLLRVVQHGEAACHTGYRSCYHRRLLPDETYETVAERVFDPELVYSTAQTSSFPAQDVLHIAIDPINLPEEHTETQLTTLLETKMHQLYGVYLYLRDHDLSEQSNTSRLLQEHSSNYLVARLADELQELADVQFGEHAHTGRQPDTILEASQVGYWLLLLAATNNVPYNDFMPHASILQGYHEHYSEGKSIEQRQECLSLLTANEPARMARGLQLGFTLIGRACAEAQVSPLAPTEYDLEQMRRKGLLYLI